eukprot:Skav236039  [mRNA]  locus=scaffold1509:140025:141004:- [translate_table: standard]
MRLAGQARLDQISAFAPSSPPQQNAKFPFQQLQPPGSPAQLASMVDPSKEGRYGGSRIFACCTKKTMMI